MYGIPTVFDSESFELEVELNGRAWDTSGSSFVQIPSVFLEIRFSPMYTMSGLPFNLLTTYKYYFDLLKPQAFWLLAYSVEKLDSATPSRTLEW